MNQYLLVYNRSTGELRHEDLGTDRPSAQKRRAEIEQEEILDPEVEVVVLNAPSLDDLKRTHARYFRRVEELARTMDDRLSR